MALVFVRLSTSHQKRSPNRFVFPTKNGLSRPRDLYLDDETE